MNGCDHFVAEESMEDAIVCCGSECDGFAAEGFGDFDDAAEQMSLTALLDAAHDIARCIVERNDGFDVVARAGLIATDRHGHVDRLVRALGVVDRAPALESSFGGGKVDEWPARQHVGLESAVKSARPCPWSVGDRSASG